MRKPTCRYSWIKYRVPNKDGVSSIDMKRLKETFGGIGGRLFTFGTGKFGQVMNTYSPDVNLFEAVKQKKIIYVMLPTMGKDNAATNFGEGFHGRSAHHDLVAASHAG